MTTQERLDFGINCYKEGKNNEAIAVWSSIRHDDNPEIYAWAQLHLGGTYQNLGRLNEAIAAWSQVRHDDPKAYALAQFNIGVAYKSMGRPGEAIVAWSNIRREDNPELYEIGRAHV